MYHRVGGFPVEYEMFAEPLLSARFHAAGYDIGHAARSVINHIDKHPVSDLGTKLQLRAGTSACSASTTPAGRGRRTSPTRRSGNAGAAPTRQPTRIEARLRWKELRRGKGSAWDFAKLLPAAAGEPVVAGRCRSSAPGDTTSAFTGFAQAKPGPMLLPTGAYSHVIRTRTEFLTRLGEQQIELGNDVSVEELPLPLLAGFHLGRTAGRATVPLVGAAGARQARAAAGRADRWNLTTRELRPPLSLRGVRERARRAGRRPRRGRGRDSRNGGEAHRRPGLQYLTLKCAWSRAGRFCESSGCRCSAFARSAEQRVRLAA